MPQLLVLETNEFVHFYPFRLGHLFAAHLALQSKWGDAGILNQVSQVLCVNYFIYLLVLSPFRILLFSGRCLRDVATIILRFASLKIASGIRQTSKVQGYLLSLQSPPGITVQCASSAFSYERATRLFRKLPRQASCSTWIIMPRSAIRAIL